MKIKTLLSLFLFFLFSIATSWAEDSYPEYITDIKLIGGTQDMVDDLKPAYKKLGWTIIDVNLNEGVTGSDFVFLIYKKGSRASTYGGFVTDLYLNAQPEHSDYPDGSQTKTITYGNHTYDRAPYDGDSDFYTYSGHLNAKAGGMNIHLYYTKQNFSDKRALTSITCNGERTNVDNDKVLYWWNDLSNDPANVNIGNNGRAIYIHVTTATMKNRPLSDPIMATGLVYNGQPQKLIKTAATISSGTMFYKVGSGDYIWHSSNVTATEAGNHTVSYYAGANDYGDASDVFSQTVTIAKSPNSSASIPETSTLYSDETLPLPVANNLSTGTITYKYSTSQNGTYSTTKPVSSGTYWVKAEIAGDDNCDPYTTAAASFRFVGWMGSGTSAKPYIISSTEELDLLASRVNNGNTYNGAYFELGANITYIPVDADNDGEYESNFTPIGDEDLSFTGNFDGKGHTVSGIVVKSGGNFAGFFGRAAGSASIKNLTIANSTIEGINFVGGIVGYTGNSNVVIENCHVSQDSVKGSYYVGGIVGYNYGNIRGSSSDATVSGSSDVGGIVGKNNGSVENSLYFGTSVTARQKYFVGAISGELKSSGSLDNNYHTLSGMGGIGNSESATGEDTDKAKFAAPFTDEPAGIGDAGTPYGTGNYVGITPYTNGLKYKGKFYRIPWIGSGTGTDPYIISSTEGLDLLAQKVNGGNDYDGKYFELGADIKYESKPLTIDLDGDGPNLSNYTPIGKENAAFWGKFDGKGHTISGIVVKSSSDYVGLFGYVIGNSPSIKNLTLANSSIEGNNHVGGIVGSTSLHVVIENCHVSDVRVEGLENVGGIVGQNGGKIRGGNSAARVSGRVDVGGVVGENVSGYGSVEYSLYYGTSVTATDNRYVGAIAGNVGVDGSITNNYYTLSGLGGVGNSESATGEDTDDARKAVAFSAADGVTLTPVGNPVNYDVSGITAYEKDGKFSSGILYGGKLYAGETEDVMLNLGYTVSDYEVLTGYTDGNGNALKANDDGTYTLTMKSAAATVTPAIKYLWGKGAEGTAENPYIISSTEGLDLLAQKVNSGNNYKNTYFELGDNITYDPIDSDNDGELETNFTQIGNEDDYFVGKFDGKGYTISGIVVKNSSDYVGLFGRGGGSAFIKNLTLANSFIEGSARVGGIVGLAGSGVIIENCHVSDVSVDGLNQVGGIVGSNEGIVKGSTSDAKVSGERLVGGIVGGNVGSVENSLYLGTSVSATDNEYVGAVVGVYSGGVFKNNYHTHNVLGGVGNSESATGEDTEGAEFAEVFSVEPVGIGSAGTSYGTDNYVGITPYANGLKYKDNFYKPIWTGRGTETDPYIITSTEGLHLLNRKVNGGNQYKNTYFELGADITFDPVGSDNNFTPIGFGGFEFYGNFDGKGHTVSGIVVNADQMGVGLFGNVSGSASIKNLTLAKSSFVSNQNNMGGIVGAVWGADVVIENSHVSSDVSVKGTRYIGGIVGYNIGTINGCTSEAKVSGTQTVGGIVGNNLGVIENNLYLGTSVSATDNKVGAIAGYVDRGHPDCKASFTNNYHTLDGMGGVGNFESATGEDTDDAMLAKVVTEMPTDIGKAGTPYGTDDYVGITPYTRGLEYKDHFYYKPLWKGNGTEDDPYIITSTEGLDKLASDVNNGNQYKNTYFELGADIKYDSKPLTIDLDGDGPNLSNFTPIGNSSAGFGGKFDGKGHTVSGIVVESNSDYVGLFGYVGSSVSIKNLTLANSSIKGNNNVGGIVGYVAYSSDTDPFVENCHVSANVLVKGGQYVGGIAGYNSEKIIGCTSDANVSGNEYVGGIVGENGGLVKNSLYLGKSVTATKNSRVGAIAGYVSYEGSFTNNYHTLEGKGGEGNYTNTGSDTEGAEFAAPFSVVPAGIGTAETSYGTGDYVGITPYTNGLAYKGRYYYAGTLVEGYAAVQIFEDAEGKKHAIIDGEYDGPDAVYIEEYIDVTSVSFNREFTPNSGFATIMLPFDVKASNLTGVRSIIEFAGVFDNNGKKAVGMKYVWCNATLGAEEGKEHPDRNCNKYSGELKAYTPYMIEMESATLGIEGKITLTSNFGKTVGDASKGNWVFRGALQYKEWSGDEKIIENGRLWAFAAAARSGATIGKFVKFGGSNWVNPFRAYLVDCSGVQNNMDCEDYFETPSFVSRYHFADVLSTVGNSAENSLSAKTPTANAAGETASLNGMEIVIVDSGKDSVSGKEHTTVIGYVNPATGEIRMLPRTKQTYDLKGRKVGNGKKAKGAYYRR